MHLKNILQQQRQASSSAVEPWYLKLNLLSKITSLIISYYIIVIMQKISSTIFLNATWLPHNQLWASVEGASRLTQC